ncbi:MAG: hypothetical protein IT366_13610 [Candidatus Hydrogenedentes bacterium]|nr:hypothetical protein [Candidatus Hydrogenedentota bacterium]
MECHICEVRSSVGYCVECHELLCETCGMPCDQCGKMSCPTHIHETKSGKALCVGCYAERRAKKEAVKAEVVHRHTHEHRAAVDTSFQTLETAPGAEGEEISNEALVASARRVVEPWKMSLYISLAGIGLGLLLLFFPSLRHVASPIGAKSFATGLLLFVFILFSIFWSWVGLRNEEFYRDRVKCFFGIAGSVVCVILAYVTISSAPVVEARPMLKNVPQRTGGESQEQLQEWRDKALQKYQR